MSVLCIPKKEITINPINRAVSLLFLKMKIEYILLNSDPFEAVFSGFYRS